MQPAFQKNAVSEADFSERINLRITWKYLLAFFALTIVSSELHEQVHINTGRILCGSYGERNFNAWQTAADCSATSWAFLATVTGPLYSYFVMWLGVWLLIKAKRESYKTIGFSLVFAPLPFARIFTALAGGGDEKVVFQALLGDELSLTAIKILATMIVTTICLPPILISLKNIANHYRSLYVIGFCVLPLIVLGIYVLTFLNNVLKKGYLSDSPILGTPTLVLVHFLIMAVILTISGKWLLEINRKMPLASDSALR
jgi:hypothetical protein